MGLLGPLPLCRFSILWKILKYVEELRSPCPAHRTSVP